MLIQQAIFTSARTGRHAGYRLVADSGSIDPDDRRELTVWGPSHDSLLNEDPDASSVNFHPLPSGAYCVSKTIGAGAEYSARGGKQIYTQCLVVPADALGRFGNNPFAVMTAARAQGAICVHDPVPSSVEPIQLVGRASAVDRRLLEKLHRNQDADWVAAAVQVALEADSVALVGPVRAEMVMTAVINCLPPACRRNISFTTGLKYSASRGFRVFTLPDEAVEQRRVVRQTGAVLFDSGNVPSRDGAADPGWPQFVWAALQTGNVSFLTDQIGKVPPTITASELQLLGRQLLEELPTVDAGTGPRGSSAARRGDHQTQSDSGHSVGMDIRDTPKTAPSALAQAEADSPCPIDGLPTTAAAVLPSTVATASGPQVYPRLADDTSNAPAQWLGMADPAALELLERLDDAVFDAVTGQEFSLPEIAELWSEVRQHVGKHLLEESREKYVQHALRVWSQSVRGDAVHDPSAAVRAVEIISTFFGG